MDRERHRPGGSDGLTLEQRGMIGDTATAALVGADGTIDWYCPRRFDAPAALFRLLDPEGGAVRVGPAGTGRRPGTQSYDAGSNVLRTVLPAAAGELEIIDAMPWDGTSERPPGRVVRVATVRQGTVDVEVEVTPGSAFGPSHRVSGWSEGIAFDSLVVRAGIPFDGRRAVSTLAAGDRLVVTIDLADAERHHQPLPPAAALQLIDDTNGAWRRHLSDLTYDGPYRAQVERSLLILKALTFHATGALVASATTSLPEMPGGERNWDQRYAWVRDACMAIDAAEGTGLTTEADIFTHWVASVLESGHLPIRAACAVNGDELPEEGELPLAGRRHSQPVRTGNAIGGSADDGSGDGPGDGWDGDGARLQLDVYADLVGAVRLDQLLSDGPMLERWGDLAAAMDWLADHWRHPDQGVWELRGEPRQLLWSKLACWQAFDRMTRLAQAKNPLDLAAVVWHESARDVMAWLEESALVAAADRPSDAADVGDEELLDASLLRLAWSGPWPAEHRVVTRTVDRILRNLSTGAHVHRYPTTFDDGLPAGEGAFTACSFWAVRALAAMGRWEEAHGRMEVLCSLGRPLGVLSSHVDPTSSALLGNLPSALSHLTLVQAALALEAGPR